MAIFRSSYSFRVTAINSLNAAPPDAVSSNVQPLATTGPSTTQSTTQSTYDAIVFVIGGHEQTQDELNKGLGVGAIAQQLRNNPNLKVVLIAEWKNKHLQATGPDNILATEFAAAEAIGITKYAIVGYSHGGGVAYNLSQRIYNSFNTVQRAEFTFFYSAYIDAVGRDDNDDPLWPPVTTRPINSMHNENYYENKSLNIGFPHGSGLTNDQAGDVDEIINHTDNNQGSIGHTNIDLQPSIQNDIINDLNRAYQQDSGQ